MKHLADDPELRARYERATTVFFDCDGVIFDSNGFKISAMHRTLGAHGEREREAMERFWTQNGGVSRYEKFRHFFSQIAPAPDVTAAVAEAAQRFGAYSRAAYDDHEPIEGALRLARHAGRARSFVVSGADQAELESVFAQKGLTPLFAEVLGSPRPKLELVRGVLERTGRAASDAILIGDGAGDHRTCSRLGVHFVYLAQFSEWGGAREVLRDAEGVTWADDWASLLAALGV